MNTRRLIEQDRQFVWHPYSAIGADLPVYPVKSAQGVRIKLMDGRELIDGMSSWWSVIHGYNHPLINQALEQQLQAMAHVMFGGLTHQPAVDLARKLIAITPEVLQTVFFADSGSVAVEIAMKMALQYWQAKNQTGKHKILTIRHGYHGDTFGAMSVSDPVNGMHHLFADSLTPQLFAEGPRCGFHQPCTEADIEPLRSQLQKHAANIAAIILEPIVQGAGGMRFYAPAYLQQIRELCNQHQVLLILDEIATGFGRTGKLFACEHAAVAPDILCLGKALTGGYMTLAATLCSTAIAQTISAADPGLFMHGPTFMANPLACSAALASLEILLSSNWQEQISKLEQNMRRGLEPCKQYPQVADVRVLGGIGVVELVKPVDLKRIQPLFVAAGVWIRPFNRLIYLMPPYIIDNNDLKQLTDAVTAIVAQL